MLMWDIERIARTSKILNAVSNLNRNILICFFQSMTYRLFVGISISFGGLISKNYTNSRIMRAISKVARDMSLADIGFFIILVVLFNTIFVAIAKRPMDGFSVAGRVLLIIEGLVLISHKKR